MGRAADELGVWLERVGVGGSEATPEEGCARISLAVDRRALIAERARLLTAYIRRFADERQVACAYTRIRAETQHRVIQETRAWLGAVRRRLGPADRTGDRPA
jgi:hypothetical protein